MAKTKSNKDLYRRLRDSGLRKKTAKRASEALPAKGQKKPSAAHRLADELAAAADSIRERAGGGSRKRSRAAAKASRTRKAKAAKRSSAAKKGARARAGK
ncbi:MAG: hypothetical protein ACXWFN_09045 [Solirubrobacterales bacterium]